MQIDLRGGIKLNLPPLPSAYELLPWRESLLETHAEAKYLSFRDEMDTSVFPCLGQTDGCLRLMRDITFREGFLPEATWLAIYRDPQRRDVHPCGTIQAIRTEPRVGSIQNIGVTQDHRGIGLGSWLVLKALEGFVEVGLHFGHLEVTAHNTAAIRLYQRLGFRRLKTVYKTAEIRAN